MNYKSRVLDKLIEVIRDRKDKELKDSYTNELFKKGKEKIANKVGEEATETITAFLVQSDQDLAEETADLIYHLFVLLEHANVSPDRVWEVLEKRLNTNK